MPDATVRSMKLFACQLGGWALALSVITPALADPDAAPKSAAELVACARANAPQQTFKQDAELETIRADGDSRTLYIRVAARKGESGIDANLKVRNPPDLSGMAFLVLANEGDQDTMFTYVPALNRSRRVTGNASTQSLWGTDFTYADIRGLLGAVDGGEASRGDDETVAGHPVYRLNVIPDQASEADYARVELALEQAHCVPLRARFYDASDTVVRELDVDPDSIEQSGDHHFARKMTMHNRQTGSRTRVELSRVEFDESIPRRAFHPRGFETVD